MPYIETHLISEITSTTPNSVFPILVYRNVLGKSMTDQSIPEIVRQKNVKSYFKNNDWEVDVCIKQAEQAF